MCREQLHSKFSKTERQKWVQKSFRNSENQDKVSQRQCSTVGYKGAVHVPLTNDHAADVSPKNPHHVTS